MTGPVNAVLGAVGALVWRAGFLAGYVTGKFLNSYRAARRQPLDVRSQMANRRLP